MYFSDIELFGHLLYRDIYKTNMTIKKKKKTIVDVDLKWALEKKYIYVYVYD